MIRNRPGMTLIEIALAVAIGLIVIAASAAGFSGVQRNAKFSSAKSTVGTVQTNLGMDKFRTGSPPPFANVANNRDSLGKPLFPGSNGTLPGDPIHNVNGVLIFNSAASPVPLASNAPTPAWDHPNFLGSPVPSPVAGFTPPPGYIAPAGYGRGGWLYDPATGAFRANLSNQEYQDQRPGTW
jgi:prepilin-type N-terminal cleavage/methylation domain-containing protein